MYCITKENCTSILIKNTTTEIVTNYTQIKIKIENHLVCEVSIIITYTSSKNI